MNEDTWQIITCSLLSSARKGTFLRNSHLDTIWLLAVVARERRKVDRSIVHRRDGAVALTVAALSQLYMRASSPKEPPGPYTQTRSPFTYACPAVCVRV